MHHEKTMKRLGLGSLYYYRWTLRGGFDAAQIDDVVVVIVLAANERFDF